MPPIFAVSTYPAYGDCPWIQWNYRCTAEHGAKTERLVYKVPEQCGPMLKLEDSGVGHPGATCLAGKRVFIVGDSLLHELLHSIECRLRKHVVRRDVVATWQYKPGQIMEKQVRVHFENGMLIEYIFIGDERQQHPLESTFRSHHFWRFANMSSDLIMTNLGVFHLTDLEYEREQRTLKILSFGNELAKIPGRIMIFGASAKHVNDRGPFSCGQDGLDEEEMRVWAPTQVEGLISHKGKALHWMAMQHGFDFVPMEPMTKTRIDAHVSATDCSHYCLPGIPDIWADIAVSQLCTP